MLLSTDAVEEADTTGVPKLQAIIELDQEGWAVSIESVLMTSPKPYTFLTNRRLLKYGRSRNRCFHIGQNQTPQVTDFLVARTPQGFTDKCTI